MVRGMFSTPAAVLAAPPNSVRPFRGAWAALAAAGCGWLLLGWAPGAAVGIFARIAAAIVSALSGSPLVRVDEGWLLAGLEPRLVVSAACSATDYFLITATLIAWHLGRQTRRFPVAVGIAVVAALPVTWLVNAGRILVVGQVHRWVIPLFPDAYAAFLHLSAGVIVFLPALIALNLLLEHHGHRLHFSCRRS